MRVAALQIAHRFGDPTSVLAQVDRLLTSVGPLDLVLLPEACLTGYVSPTGDFDLRPQAEPLDGPTSGRLADLARRHRVVLAAPCIELAPEGHCFNTYVVLDAFGQRIAHYRKRHPWFPETWATPGEQPYPLLTIAGRAVSLAVCFDVHFVSEEAGEILDQAEVLLFPSAWVDSQQPDDSRSDLLPKLASRHHLAIVNANWAHSTPALLGQGGSRILDARGQRLTTAPHGGSCAVVAEV